MEEKEQSALTIDEECYLRQMEAWIKEQQAREKQLLATIETSKEVVRQNEIQLEWHRKFFNSSLKEFEEWKEERKI
ncbi:hypothetical protein AADC60_24555 [Cytobacillus pseudoceanisediminis]|uniref:Uncharacterized protein n=1 Tax=Cytobacillus pseudoceanisediminis TaxID=3051614 RepID=A0ABZ2ZGD0_9BACI